MLDIRIYRAAFVPAVLALVIGAFSLRDKPGPATTRLSAETFSGARAFGPGHGLAPKDSLLELADAFPVRRSGSDADVKLSLRAAQVFGANGLQVRRDVSTARTVEGKVGLTAVVGTRPGLDTRRIVVVAYRDSTNSPGVAELSGTAALFEVARVFKQRDLGKTLVLISASGRAGGASAAQIKRLLGSTENIDAVFVLGDLASKSARKPWIVPWSNGTVHPSLALERTLESAARAELRVDPGGAGMIGQWIRRAAPLSSSAQGELAADGLPAVLVQASGERGPKPNAEVDRSRFLGFGRMVVRGISSLDDERKSSAHVSASGHRHSVARDGITIINKVLPDWTVKLLVGALLLPILLASIDGFLRAFRKGLRPHFWLGWVATAVFPFLFGWGWLQIIGIAGGLNATPAPVLPEPIHFGWSGGLVVGSTVMVIGLGWFVLRSLRHQWGGPFEIAMGGAGAATGLLIAVLCGLLWMWNEYAAAFLVIPAHVWLFATTPGSIVRGRMGAVLCCLAALPLGVVCLYYLMALGANPFTLSWGLLVAAVGGYPSIHFAGFFSSALAVFISVLIVVRSTRKADGELPAAPIRTRGPVSYAGPGSLGGTNSGFVGSGR